MPLIIVRLRYRSASNRVFCSSAGRRTMALCVLALRGLLSGCLPSAPVTTQTGSKLIAYSMLAVSALALAVFTEGLKSNSSHGEVLATTLRL